MSSTSNVAHVRRPSSITADLLRHPVDTAESLESSALVIGAVVFVDRRDRRGARVLGRRPLEIAGRGSLGEFVAIGGAIAAILAFLLGRDPPRRGAGRRGRAARPPRRTPGARLHWFDVIALARRARPSSRCSAGSASADLLERSFQGAVVFPIPAPCSRASPSRVTAYVCVPLGRAPDADAALARARAVPRGGRAREHAELQRSAVVAEEPQRARHDRRHLRARLQPHAHHRRR